VLQKHSYLFASPLFLHADASDAQEPPGQPASPPRPCWEGLSPSPSLWKHPRVTPLWVLASAWGKRGLPHAWD